MNLKASQGTKLSLPLFFTKARFLLCLLIPHFALAGCSFNSFGLPIHELYSEESDESLTAKVVRTRAKGLHFETRESLGIYFGVYERELIYPTKRQANEGCLPDFSSAPRNSTRSNTLAAYHDEPIQMTTKLYGVGLSASLYEVTGAVGASHKRVVRVPSQKSFSFFYDNTNSDLGTVICAVVWPEAKKDVSNEQ